MSQPFLSGAAIFAAPDLGFQDVAVPEWGGTVRIVQLSAAETAAFTKTMHVTQETDGMYVILIYTLRDESRARLFTFEHEDPTTQHNQLLALIAQIKEKSMSVLLELQKVALHINKMGVVEKAVLKKD